MRESLANEVSINASTHALGVRDGARIGAIGEDMERSIGINWGQGCHYIG